MTILQDLRLSRGLTQEEAAKQTGIPLMSIRRYEYGERFPKPPILARLAAFYGLSPLELYAELTGETIAPEYPGKAALEGELEKYREWKRRQTGGSDGM